MYKTYAKLAFLLLLLPFMLLFANTSARAGLVKGIYISQETLEDTAYLNYLIAHAKKAGIDTFVVDLEKPSDLAQKNAALIKKNDINYVARIIIFKPGVGASKEEMADKTIWEKKLKLVNKAIEYGANQIQLDYIRYNTKQKASVQNAENVVKVVQFFKDHVASQNIPLQVDVFGIASYGPELHIGQDIRLMSKQADAVCPMLYPSHFEPYIHHSEHPYETVYGSLNRIKEQFPDKITFKLYPFIELSNYRYPLSHEKKLSYIRAQIKAVEDAGADGWYAWSANNKYDNLFVVLENTKVK